MTSSKLVAVVDDDPGVRGSLDSLLRSAGVASVAFASATELLETDDPARFQWIITDLQMPGLSGLELQAELAHRACRCSVILMTSYPTPSAESQALRAGATAFLTKPIDPDVLLDTIEAG